MALDMFSYMLGNGAGSGSGGGSSSGDLSLANVTIVNNQTDGYLDVYLPYVYDEDGDAALTFNGESVENGQAIKLQVPLYQGVFTAWRQMGLDTNGEIVGSGGVAVGDEIITITGDGVITVTDGDAGGGSM